MSTRSLAEALARILAETHPVGETETLPAELVATRITARPVVTTVNLPPFSNSAMDGYAFRAADLDPTQATDLILQGVALAGKPYLEPLRPGHCLRIMTGAMPPVGADSVIMQEHVEVEGDRARLPAGCRGGEHIRPAGEEATTGDPIIPAGKRLGPAEMGLLAAGNCLEVEVYRRLRVAFFSSGDELRAPGEPLTNGQLYDANRPILRAMLASLGCDCVDLGIIPDTPADLREALHTGAMNADMIITSGGVSVGDADYIKDLLNEQGTTSFWKLAIKPGHPLAFGHYENAVFFGLPGNPVSAMVTCAQLVLPALRRMAGEDPLPPTLELQARCESSLRKKAGRREFQRGMLFRDETGPWRVQTTGAQGSGMLTSLSRANAFIVLPEENQGVEPGDTVTVQPFAGLW